MATRCGHLLGLISSGLKVDLHGIYKTITMFCLTSKLSQSTHRKKFKTKTTPINTLNITLELTPLKLHVTASYNLFLSKLIMFGDLCKPTFTQIINFSTVISKKKILPCTRT